MVYRKLPQRLRPERARTVFAALMDCRRAARQSALNLQPRCPVDLALDGLVRSIDALCAYLVRLKHEGDVMDYALSEALHAPARHNRPNVLEEPALLLSDLRGCRTLLLAAQGEVAVMGATYQAIQVVHASIDALTVLLTGDSGYFLNLTSGATVGDQQREARKLAREQGES